MGKIRIALRRRPIHAATKSRAVSRTATAATSRRNTASPRGHASGPLMAKTTNTSSGKKMWTRISTPIHRPSGIDQPRIPTIVVVVAVGGSPVRFLPRISGRSWLSIILVIDARNRRILSLARAQRPTSDRLRETLFNVLAPRISGASFLDLYAGSGAVGIEAISRGASRVAFVERDPAAARVLRGNLESLHISEGFRVHAGSVKTFLQKRAADAGPKPDPNDIVFLDPPYDAADEYA